MSSYRLLRRRVFTPGSYFVVSSRVRHVCSRRKKTVKLTQHLLGTVPVCRGWRGTAKEAELSKQSYSCNAERVEKPQAAPRRHGVIGRSNGQVALNVSNGKVALNRSNVNGQVALNIPNGQVALKNGSNGQRERRLLHVIPVGAPRRYTYMLHGEGFAIRRVDMLSPRPACTPSVQESYYTTVLYSSISVPYVPSRPEGTHTHRTLTCSIPTHRIYSRSLWCMRRSVGV